MFGKKSKELTLADIKKELAVQTGAELTPAVTNYIDDKFDQLHLQIMDMMERQAEAMARHAGAAQSAGYVAAMAGTGGFTEMVDDEVTESFEARAADAAAKGHGLEDRPLTREQALPLITGNTRAFLRIKG